MRHSWQRWGKHGNTDKALRAALRNTRQYGSEHKNRGPTKPLFIRDKSRLCCQSGQTEKCISNRSKTSASCWHIRAGTPAYTELNYCYFTLMSPHQCLLIFVLCLWGRDNTVLPFKSSPRFSDGWRELNGFSAWLDTWCLRVRTLCVACVCSSRGDCWSGLSSHCGDFSLQRPHLSQRQQIVPLDMKGCICHFVKWQIRPFISKGTKLHAPRPIIRLHNYSQLINIWGQILFFQCGIN